MKAGITGHQNIGSPDDIAWTEQMLSSKISEMNITRGFTSLAVGADQLFASILRQQGIQYTAVIPCEGYENTFSDSVTKHQFEELRFAASAVEVLPFDHPEEQAFWEAGKQVVELSDVMLAVWNGLPAKGLGGTADVVQFALESSKRVLCINPVERQVVDLFHSKKAAVGEIMINKT